MKILVACERSGRVRDAFIRKGHYAVSADLLPCSSGLGEHYQGDCFDITGMGWDMVIAFPPCTDISGAGASQWKQKIADGRQRAGIDFFMRFVGLPVKKLCIENPQGAISKYWRKPDQVIHPYYFGDEFQKRTCLWLRGLPKLVHQAKPDLFSSEVTHVGKGEIQTFSSGKKMAKWFSNNKKERSITFPGIAAAMAAQWG